MKHAFCAVFQRNGTVQAPWFNSDLKELVKKLHKELDDSFDPETDDVRVFNEHGQSVYVFTPHWELEREGFAEYIKEDGSEIVITPNQGTVITGEIKMMRVYPQDNGKRHA